MKISEHSIILNCFQKDNKNSFAYWIIDMKIEKLQSLTKPSNLEVIRY